MPVELRIEGAQDLERVSRRLKQLGDKELKNELSRGINRAVKPMKDEVKAAALRDLPKRGGLNKFVAKLSWKTKTKTSGQSVGVTIVADKSGHDLKAIDRGRVRHPVFGNRRAWVLQQVKAGFFSNTVRGHADRIRRELLALVADIERRL